MLLNSDNTENSEFVFHIQSPPESAASSLSPEIPEISGPEKQFVEDMLRGITLANPVRICAQAVLQGYVPEAHEIAEAISVLKMPNASKWREQATVCWVLGRMPLSKESSKNACEWLSILISTYSRRDGSARISRTIMRTMIGVYALTALIGLANPVIYVGMFIAWAPALSLSILAHPFSSRFDKRRMNKVRTMAATAIGSHKEVIALPAIANAVYDSAENVRTAAIWSLGKIAENLTTDDFKTAPFETTNVVCRLLGHSLPHVRLTALRILRIVGRGSALEPVQRLLKRSGDPIIQEEALKLLPILIQRRELERESSRLLRSSDGVAGSDKLLRVPIGNNDTDPNLLLRPIDADEKA